MVEASLSPHTLFSARWHRVAGLCPRLRQQVELRRQPQRGVDWFLLVDTASGEVRRLNRAAYEFIGRCDGHSSVRRVWEAVLTAMPDVAMSQDEVVQLLSSLHERQLLEVDHAPDVEAVFRRRDQVRRRRRWLAVNPMAFRLAMVDPSPWIERLAPAGRWIFSAWGLLAWGVLVLAAAWVGLPQLGALYAEATRLAGSPSDLALAWFVYPFIKGVHEAAHALAMRRWGITPRRAGITLLLLTPVPFVDASATDALRQPHRRAVVSAAGILAELAVASLALLLWSLVEPGLVRDLALSAVLIGTVSTLLVNGNPLLRLDGYYVLSDLLDLRNLAPRSARWWQTLARRVLLGDRHAEPMTTVPGEWPWLVAFSPLSMLFRLALCMATVLWIGQHSAVLGALVGISLGLALLGRPLWSGLQALRFQPGLSPWARTATAVTLVVLLVGVVEWPHHHVATGVVLPPEQSQLRLGSDGFISEWLVRDGQAVGPGVVVGRLSDDELVARRAELQADLTEADVRLYDALVSGSDEVSALGERLATRQAGLMRIDERLALLDVKAGAAGTLVLPHQGDQLGGYLRRGELLGYVMNGAPLVLRVAVPQSEADLLQVASRQVEVRLAQSPHVVIAGQVGPERGAAVMQLPSAALGDHGGGSLATDPADPQGLTTVSPVFVLDVEVKGLQSDHIGGRAFVRFDLGTQTLASRAARQVRQLLLGSFNPSA